MSLFPCKNWRQARYRTKPSGSGLRGIVITASIAKKYFGDEDPVERTLTVDTGEKFDVTVTGVMEDHPPTADFAPEILLSMETLRAIEPDSDSRFDNRVSQQVRAYILLPESNNAAEVEKKIMSVFKPHLTAGINFMNLATARCARRGQGSRPPQSRHR